jgi:pimeloyl-ACP methyl ester carboxylesterase
MNTQKTLLLIHGFMEDARIWEPMLPLWSKKYKILAPDLGGFGLRVQEPFLGIDEEAEKLWSWLNTLGVEEIVIAGHSLGGYIGLAMAEQNPNRIEEFWLINSHAAADGTLKQNNRTRLAEMVRSKGTGLFLEGFHRSLFAPLNREKFQHITQQLQQRAAYILPETVAKTAESMRDRPNRTEVVKHLGKKILYFIGTEDESIEPWQIEETSRFIPAENIFIMKGVGHMAMYEYNGKDE